MRASIWRCSGDAPRNISQAFEIDVPATCWTRATGTTADMLRYCMCTRSVVRYSQGRHNAHHPVDSLDARDIKQGMSFYRVASGPLWRGHATPRETGHSKSHASADVRARADDRMQNVTKDGIARKLKKSGVA